MAGEFTNALKSVKDNVVSLFSSHKRRINQIEHYLDKPVEVSDDFKSYAKNLPAKTRKKCDRAKKKGSFDLFGFSTDWDSIDEYTLQEKKRLYRQYFAASSEHDKHEIAAMTRLNEIQYELAAAQTQLDVLYDKLLFLNTVYRWGNAETADPKPSEDIEETPADAADGVPM